MTLENRIFAEMSAQADKPELAENEIPRIEWFSDRWYKIVTVDEKGVPAIEYYPSVTSILGIIAKHGLDRWRGDIGNREADLKMHDAQWRGKRIHHAWETYLKGGIVGFWETNIEEKPDYSYCFTLQDEYVDFLKLVEFLRVTNAQPLASEITVLSHTWKEAGTLDNIFIIKDGKYLINGKTPVELEAGLYIGDLKTGKEVYEEGFCQVAAYAKMYEEMYPDREKIKGALILHTSATVKNGIYGFATKVLTIEEINEYYEEYRHAAAIYKRRNRDVQPRTFDFVKYVQLKKGE